MLSQKLKMSDFGLSLLWSLFYSFFSAVCDAFIAFKFPFYMGILIIGIIRFWYLFHRYMTEGND